VSVKPGATAFARMPCSAQSIASERVGGVDQHVESAVGLLDLVREAV
jgi:hypothetical protein